MYYHIYFNELGKKLVFLQSPYYKFFLKFHIHKILYFNTQKSNMREGAEILKKKKVKTDTAKYLMNNYRRRQNKYYAFSRVTGLPRDIKANKVVAYDNDIILRLTPKSNFHTIPVRARGTPAR